jgi:hypothetical protein
VGVYKAASKGYLRRAGGPDVARNRRPPRAIKKEDEGGASAAGAPLITLTTDIGFAYAAQMKGVLIGLAPSARIVDITHDIQAQNVREAAFVLMTTLHRFPGGVHLCIVDPGVGTKRRGLVLECGAHTLIGPDNGVLVPAARALGLKGSWAVKKDLEKGASRTFHGRDVFAPVAARLANGEAPAGFCEPAEKLMEMDFGRAEAGKGKAEALVVYIDRFGNVVTNLEQKQFAGAFPGAGEIGVQVEGGREFRAEVAQTYGEAHSGIVVLPSSSGFVEIASPGGSAQRLTGAAPGMKVGFRQYVGSGPPP